MSESSAPQVATIGETMAAARTAGPMRLGGSMQLTIAGAESNVAIGLARLGHQARWVGRVGADEIGALVLRTLRAEQVDVGHAVTDRDGRPTALLLSEARLADLRRVSYYRAGSAGSAITAEDVLPALEPGVRLLHLTGITPALSRSATETVVTAAHTARQAGTTVSLDVNYRSRLWTRQQARKTLCRLIPYVDLLVASEDELPLALAKPPAGERDSVKALLDAGVGEVVIKRGSAGAGVTTHDGETTCAARRVNAVDVVGAGDAFVAGYLSAYLDGRPVDARLHRAVTTAAFCVATLGDWEGLPTRDELGLLDGPDGLTLR